jgi:D-alanine-D-alanine ligase
MSKKAKSVLVLYDLPEPIGHHDTPGYLLEHEDRPTERDISRAIKRMGLNLQVHGVFDEVQELWKKLETTKPDLVFNLCETYRGDRAHEGDVASILELAGVSYTGSRPPALHLCKDKGATKKIAGWDGIKVPAFMVYPHDGFKFERFAAQFPLIVKPLNREASEGIAQASVVHDWLACEERAAWVADRLKSDVIVEEYIHGRELYVGVVEDSSVLRVLPPRELFFANLSKTEPMVATYRAKWDDAYRAKWGISTGRATNLGGAAGKGLAEASLKMFRALGLRGYARLDWRMTEDGEPVFLEANPNPALAMDDDFAKAAKLGGYSYGELVAAIIGSALGESCGAARFENNRASRSL